MKYLGSVANKKDITRKEYVDEQLENKLGKTETAAAAKKIDIQAISRSVSVNLNNYVTDGVYSWAAGTTSMMNEPTGETGLGIMFVTVSKNSANYLTQEIHYLYNASAVRIYRRNKFNTTWTAWDRVLTANQGYIPDLAGTLKSIPLPENADLNEYTDQGFYVSGANSAVANYTNCPTTSAFSMFVYRSYNNDATATQELHTYPTSSPEIYVRTLYSETWGAWKAVAFTDDNLGEGKFLPLTGGEINGDLNVNGGLTVNDENVFSGSPIPLSSGEDLNNITSPGYYTAVTGTLTATLLNCPSELANGAISMFVYYWYGSGSTRTLPICQIVTESNTNTSNLNFYVRVKYNTLWGAWKKLATTEDNVASATKLETARTIRTNLASTTTASFDGSENITPGVTGTLPIANGGTGLTASPSILINLASTAAANVLAASPRPGITGTLGLAHGGTGATTAATALQNLGLTATAAELNHLHGITATVTELNYTDGVTSNIQTQLNAKAALASPIFTGTPKAPTAAAGTNTTQIATTAYVKTEINNVLAAAGALIYKGTIGTDGTVTALPASHTVGDIYVVSTAGSYAGETCEIGDMIICVTTRTTANNADWNIVQTNINGAVTGPASAVTNRVATFNGTTGKVIKDSGFTIASSVPANAKFTDTTYTLSSFGITATATELNRLDGITATTAELNYTDGVTSNIQTQLNSKAANTAMKGATSSAAGTAGLAPAPSAGAANRYLRSDGTWAVPPDTNTTYTLSSFGITATAAELNHLDGITATVTELNYIDGVTSNVQTQINSANTAINNKVQGMTQSQYDALSTKASGVLYCIYEE